MNEIDDNQLVLNEILLLILHQILLLIFHLQINIEEKIDDLLSKYVLLQLYYQIKLNDNQQLKQLYMDHLDYQLVLHQVLILSI